MISLKIYHVNAFSETAFGGNPAAVVPLEFWLSDEIMQQIAFQNNLSETAFFVKTSSGYQIRWFTPKVEVNLCGHATLASSYVLFEILKIEEKTLVFDSKSGPLYVTKQNDTIFLDFPAVEFEEVEPNLEIQTGLKLKPLATFKAIDDYMLVFESESDVLNADPDFGILAKTNARGIIVTAPSNNFDFVCRFFAPRVGINEDPVTGSAFTKLIPYWSKKLNKTIMNACQVSERKGFVNCEYKNDRVLIGGKPNLYLVGEIFI